MPDLAVRDAPDLDWLDADEPLDLAAVDADDELISAVAAGRAGPDAGDALTRMLVAWAAECRAVECRPSHHSDRSLADSYRLTGAGGRSGHPAPTTTDRTDRP